MSKKKVSFEVTVSIAPLSGSPVTKTVKVEASATLEEVAKAAGVSNLDKKNLLVDGKPATPETRVTSASKVTITERPQGS